MAGRWQRAADVALALVVLLVALAEIWVPFESRAGTGDRGWSTLQVLILASALCWRRTQPLPAVVVAGFAMIAFHAAGVAYLLFNGQLVPLLLLTFAVARYGRGRDPYLGGLVVAGTMLLGDFTIQELGSASEMIFHWGALGMTYVLGTWQRLTAHRAEQARDRAVAAEARAVAAVLEERTRIARELHDVVAHAVTQMVVTAGAAEGMAETPEAVRRSLATIRQTGSGALTEMRRVVTMLRDADEAASRAPQPGLAALESLVADARATGLPISFEVTGQPRDLPAGLDLTAFRVVQEALTNAQRHARAATEVAVRLDFTDQELSIEVHDDGTASPGTGGTGHGLIGMRERVHLYGGRLRTGPRADRGFAVEVALPLEAG